MTLHPGIMGYIKGLQYNDRVALDDEGAQEREYARSKMSHWGAARERRCRRRQEEEASNRLYAENELRHR